MRINKFVALKTGLSRRAADTVIEEGRVRVNGLPPETGQQIAPSDSVTLDGRTLEQDVTAQTIMLNKPVGYVCSRNGQGAKTIYTLLPPELSHLKPIGRLDKDSSGLLLLTNDGDLAHQLTHPSFQKEKRYIITLDRPLDDSDRSRIEAGVDLDDGPSRLQLKPQDADTWQVTMREGRNRQIRRTFAALGYTVTTLHRIAFGTHTLPSNLAPGQSLTILK